jgi:hypothetical protein
VWDLNSQLTDLVKGHSEITRRRPKMLAKGTLNPKAKGFIGVPKENRSEREHQELINNLKKQPTEFIQELTEEVALAACWKMINCIITDFSCTAVNRCLYS